MFHVLSCICVGAFAGPSSCYAVPSSGQSYSPKQSSVEAIPILYYVYPRLSALQDRDLEFHPLPISSECWGQNCGAKSRGVGVGKINLTQRSRETSGRKGVAPDPVGGRQDGRAILLFATAWAKAGHLLKEQRDDRCVVGGSMAKWLVEDRAGNVREGTMSLAYRSRLEDRNSSDLALVSFRTAGRLVTLRPGSVQGVNSQAF